MKLNFVAAEASSAPNDLGELSFSLGDPSFIFDVLRNKMYSNAILAICREISCNAKDSHIEAGKPNEPIQITLPTYSEPFYKVKDFGVGISPERIENIYLKYGVSTKRNDNSQIGAMGLGAKTPLAYTDSFSIITIYNGIRYNYQCYMDETRIGKLVLLSETATEECNGTEIIVPVKQQNFDDFRRWTELSTRHWSVKPKILGVANFTYEQIKQIFSGDDWKICVSSGYDKKHKIIIGEIEYPLEINSLDQKFDWISSIYGEAYLYFNIGDLSISANREQIYLDQPTKKAIESRLLKLKNDVKQHITNSLAKEPTYFKANALWHKVLCKHFYEPRFLQPLEYNGKKLWNNAYLPVDATVVTFSTGRSFRGKNRISRSVGRNIYLENDKILIHDLPTQEPTPNQMKIVFEKNPFCKTMQVIVLGEGKTIENISEYEIEKTNMELMSSYIPIKSIRTRSNSNARLTLFKYDGSSFSQSSMASMKEDKNTKVLCRLNRSSDGVRSFCINSKNIGYKYLPEFKNKFKDVSFYGLDESVSQERIDDDFYDLVPFSEWVEDNILDSDKFDFIKIKYLNSMKNYLDHNAYYNGDKFKAHITNQDSFFLKRVEAHKIINEFVGQNTILSLYEDFNGEISKEQIDAYAKNNQEYNIEDMEKQYKEKYPLLSLINRYEYANNIKSISEYINLIDAKVII